ncbi:PI-actitoxin-Aeq3b-like [Mya arenaria]|uniref:PI-actitoxin-Aeq3b-like n=1 Tax=Mya arenaria TaxID=6604 RepID=UPI0022E6795C|nr:PI-actitoxin-Aeq3b-like [Mya arenaria]
MQIKCMLLLVVGTVLVTSQIAPVLPVDETAIACQEPMVAGPCKGFFPRFFYNTDEGLCQKFVYGGCQGNSNNFMTQEDCEQRCIQATTPTK